jgi:hypothetical protein
VTAAPVWLSYAAPTIALVALLVSLATYRRAGPRIRARLSVPDFPSAEGEDVFSYISTIVENDFILTLRLYNRGLAAIDVTGFFASVGLSGYHISPFEFTQSDFYSGPSLPIRLEGGSSQTWELSLVEPLKRLAVLDEPARLQHKVNILQFLNPFSIPSPPLALVWHWATPPRLLPILVPGRWRNCISYIFGSEAKRVNLVVHTPVSPSAHAADMTA